MTRQDEEHDTTISLREATPSKSRSTFDLGLDTSAGLDFVRERLALFGKTVFLLSFGFFVLMVSSVAFIGGRPFVDVVRMPVAMWHFAYWMLTGKMVFEGDNAMQVMIDHARTSAPRPSLRVELPIPAPLEDLVMQCLEKEPARRPVSAEVLGARLENVAVTEPWTAERAGRWWASHQPRSPDARPAADILLSHEGRQLRIGPRARPRG